MMEFDPQDEDPRIGTILNERYRIIERIGQGGMSVVYRGERIELGRPVAIKFLQEVMLRYPKFINRFEAEAKAMSKLSHPYCVPVIDFGVEKAPYIVLDYVEGRTLKAALQQEKLTVPRAVTLVRQILAGISHAHKQGIIHRDIKPENIMLTDATGMGEHVRIFDFGLAKLLDAGPGLNVSSPSIIAGTPSYMSPEQSKGAVVDERADLYSIGVVLFELLAGRKPFQHEDFFEVVRMHREEKPPAVSKMADGRQFSAGLESLVAKALSKSPEDRFQSADEFIDALNATREGSETKEILLPAAEEPSARSDSIGRAFSEAPTMYIGAGTIAVSVRRYLSKNKQLAAASAVVVFLGLISVLWAALVSDKQDGEQSGNKPTSSRASEPTKTKVAEGAAARSRADETEDPRRPSTEQSGEKQAENGEASPGASTQVAASEEASKTFSVKSIKDVRALMDAGRTDEAIAGLRKLRREDPENAYYVLLMANLFFEKAWWGDGIDYYREAIRISPSYRSRADLNNNLIVALSSARTYKKASLAIEKSVGRSALPFLRKAAKNDKNPFTRKRAAALVKRISD